jgi:putative aldouronate transport system substrate-binding protein
MKCKTVFVILLTVVAVFGVTGCKKQAGAGYTGETAVTAEPGQFPLTEEKAELTVLLAKPAHVSDMGSNLAAKWYEDYTNVRVTYIQSPYHTARESANLSIATGEYPDIIMFSWMTSPDVINYGNQGIFIRLNDLIEEQGYWLKKAAEPIPELIPTITLPDGNIYSLPNISQTLYTFYQHKAWINRDWLDKLGLAMPETTEEFYEVLKAFKTRDPNGNGRPDEIPMIGYYGVNTQSWPYPFLLNSFVYFNPDNYLALKDGKVVFVAGTEDFREGLRYVARLVSEGLLDRVSFTQTAEQAKQLGTNPNAPLVGVFTDLLWGNVVGDRKEMPDARADSYAAVPPLRGPKGVRYAQVTSVGINPTYASITDNCKDPVLAFRWLDGMYNQEAMLNNKVGLKGVIYEDPDPGALGINRKPALFKPIINDELPAQNPYYVPMFLGNQHPDFRAGRQIDWNDPQALLETEAKAYLETMEKYHPYRPDPDEYYPVIVHHTPQEAVDAGRLGDQIKTYVRENIAAFLTGNKSVDRDWAAYVAEFNRLELPLYLELKQTAYDRQYGKK